MTLLEFTEGLKVLEQYYLTEEIGGFFQIEYDEEIKSALVIGDFSLQFDEQLDENYRIKKKIEQDKVLKTPYISEYYFKSINQFFYFLETFRNYAYKNVLPSVSFLDNMLYTYKKNIFNKSYFSISNNDWMINNQLYFATLKKRPIELSQILDDFDKCVNPFLNDEFEEEKIKYLYDTDLFTENGVKNCAHFSIKNNNIIKSYKRHSNGFLYSQKIIGETTLYVGHYFNIDGEIISIISNKEDKELKIRYNVTNRKVEYMGKTYEIDDTIIKYIKDLITMALECEAKKIYKK